MVNEWDLRLALDDKNSIDADGKFCTGDHGFTGGEETARAEANRRASLYMRGYIGALRFYCVDRSNRMLIAFDARAAA